MRRVSRIGTAIYWLLGFVVLLPACGGGGAGDGDEAEQPSGGLSSAAVVDTGQQPSTSSPSNVAAIPEPPKFTLSGTITVAGGTSVDSDVNDPLASYASNDSPVEAQFVPIPVTVVGYANVPGAGPDGRSKTAGDISDYYQVSLAAGQSVSLHIGSDGVDNDLDLFLTDLDGQQVYTFDGLPIRSISSTEFESLSAEITGSYLVLVSAHAGAARYVLQIGESAESNAAGASAQFVPGDLLVRLDDRLRVLGGDWLGPAMAQSLGMSADDGDARATLRFALETGTPRARYWRDFGLGHLFNSQAVPTDPNPDRQLLLDTPLLAKALARQGWVDSVDLNYVRSPDLTPTDPLFEQQWHYRQINVPLAWDSVPAISEVIVAVADSGVMLTHPDLSGQLVAGYDFVSNPASAADGDGVDPDPTDPGDSPVPGASTFHGTHVAGTVAAATDNGTGGAGVAWNAKIMPLRVLGRHGATDYDLIQGMRYAAGLSNASGALPQRRADVLNLSLGGPGRSRVLDEALAAVRDAGVIIVASAGNSATNSPHYPAASPGVISVSALDAESQLAPYSNFGSSVDVAAPGGNLRTDLDGDGERDGVLSTLVDDTVSPPTPSYEYLQGTSMASPHVAGVIALMLSIRPATTPDDMDAYLASGIMTTDIGAPGRDDLFGHGRIDAFKAVGAAAFGPPPPPPELTIDPPAINFSVTTSSVTMHAANGGGGGDLIGVSAVTDADWLSVTPVEVDAGGLGEYRISVDRAGLPNGSYTGNVAFISSRNAVNLSVIMQVAAGVDLTDDGGRHYVMIWDPEAGRRVAAVSVEAEQGRYAFHLNGIPAGSYHVIAGSDTDNDGIVCDAMEACGLFGGDAEPALVVVDRNHEDIEFTTGLRFAPGFAMPVVPDDGLPRAGN